MKILSEIYLPEDFAAEVRGFCLHSFLRVEELNYQQYFFFQHVIAIYPIQKVNVAL